MRKGILIMIIFCITAAFSLYILDIKPSDEPVYPDDFTYAANNQEQDMPSQDSIASAQANENDAEYNGRSTVGGWRMIWSDDFDGPYLDLERWTEVDRRDNYNNELQYFTPANSYIKNGCLYLTAKKEDKDGKAYTSAMVQTMCKFAFCYGRIEARMKLPTEEGVFPAFWLLTNEGGNEIDIMEMIGNEPTLFYGVVHYMVNGTWQKDMDLIKNQSPEQFHIYALEWEPDELRWYVDGELFFRTDRGVPSEDMYVIFTLAVGGDWPGTPPDNAQFPCNMVIDYVRCYQLQ